MAPANKNKMPPQTVGNIGLFYVCYRLSRMGWNVLPTSRNAKGVDLIIYSNDAKRTHTIQVKALSKRYPAPLGASLDNLIADFVVVCTHVVKPGTEPACFVLKSKEVRDLAVVNEKDEKKSYWLQPKQYAVDKFRDKWSRIGNG